MTLSQVDLLEGIGNGPESIQVNATLTTLITQDAHSGAYAPLQRSASGVPTYSFERWLRLRFTNDSVYVQTIRFWVPNLEPNPGWTVRMGVSDDYQRPSQSRSTIAFNAVPTEDPGVDLPNVYPTLTSVPVVDLNAYVTQYSPWLVLQATWDADNDDPIQFSPLELTFAWSESS